MTSSDMLSSAQCMQAEVHSHPHKAAISKMPQLQRPRSRSHRSPMSVKGNCARPRYVRPASDSTTFRSAGKPRRPSDSFVSHSRIARSTGTLNSAHTCDVAETDPEHTALLWKTVMSYNSPTASSKAKAKTKTATSTLASRQPPSTSDLSGPKAKKEPVAKVSDADFIEAVLAPCGITIQSDGVNMDLLQHFGIEKLPHDPKDRLDAYKKSFTLDSWVEPELETIQRGYKALRVYRANEAEYSAYALRHIFLDEPLHPWLPEESGDQCWLPVRMLQLVRKPPQNKWLAPPLIASAGKRYEWDIRPDCAYHVSLQAFQPGFRTNVRNHVSVVHQRAFCPYLTIEFKRDEEDIDTAHNQLAVASAMALYNRYCLKSVALEMSGKEWSEEHKSHIRHYGITFTGSSWSLWCTIPKTFETWTGCEMSTIYFGDCCVLAGVQHLVSIVNDLHYWGLEVHGRSCKDDIAAKIHSKLGADANEITLLED